RPRRALLGLLAAWVKKNTENPRISSRALAEQTRIEEILRAFNEARSHINRDNEQSNTAATSEVKCNANLNGTESWLRDPRSKLCGRADLIAAGEIVDFKSGEQHEHHVEQIIFYGALYLALTGRVPRVLRLIYTAKGDITNVPVPALKELECLL